MEHRAAAPIATWSLRKRMAKGANCLLVCGHVCVNLSVDMTMQLQNAGVEQHFNVLPASARVPECHSFPVPGPGPGSRPVPVPAPLPLPAANYFCGLPTTLSVLLFPSLSEHPHYPDSLLFDPLCTRPPLGGMADLGELACTLCLD